MFPPSSFISRVQELESELTTAVSENSSLNSLVDLLNLAIDAVHGSESSKAIYALYRVFVTVIRSGKYGLAVEVNDEGKVVRRWVWDRLNQYTEYLTSLLKDDEKSLRVSALQILLSLQKHLSALYSISGNPVFHVSHFKKIVSALLLCPPSTRGKRTADVAEGGSLDSDVRDLFVGTWLNVYDDVRWFFLREAASVLASSTHRSVPINLLGILEQLTKFPYNVSDLNTWWVEELGTKLRTRRSLEGTHDDDQEISSEDDVDDWRRFFEEVTTPQPNSDSARLCKISIHQSLHHIASHKAVFTRIWLLLLQKISNSKEPSMRALKVMHRYVIPHLTKPILIMDWVGTCVDCGGAVGLLALNTLFILITEYNLDYPSFYTRLYAFLDRDVLHLKHRTRFFRMLDLFLSSTHLPAIILASFIKKLSRLSLHAPPAAIVIIIPFTYNVLKKHPVLMSMIHADSDNLQSDPFLVNEPNPNLTLALDSSLWELISHKHHYHAAISTLAGILEQAFTRPGYSMEDFFDHTYDTLIDAEIAPPIKREPAISIHRGNTLFIPASEGERFAQKDYIVDYWDFT